MKRNQPSIIPFGEFFENVQKFAKQEDIDDLSEVLIVFDGENVWLKAFCGKSFNEVMQNGAFDFEKEDA